MFSLKKKQKGFTIVELLIVIVIIGILATIVIVTFTGIQKKARDSKRQTDINAVNSQIAAFYTNYGFYPTLGDLNSATFRSAYMKGLDSNALTDPKGGAMTDTAGTNHYAYKATSSDATKTCDNTAVESATSNPTDNNCDTYVLTATLENGGTFSKNSN